MPFQSWDPIVEAVFFGCAFLLPLVAVLWVWYDSSGRIGSGRWFWRLFLTALVLFTTPAVALGAAHLDHSMDDAMSAFGWTAIASGCVAILGVVAYAIWGRSPMEEYRDEAPGDRAAGHAPPVKTAKAAQTVQPMAATTPPAAQPAMPTAPAPAPPICSSRQAQIEDGSSRSATRRRSGARPVAISRSPTIACQPNTVSSNARAIPTSTWISRARTGPSSSSRAAKSGS
jgi:hypothetical protein